MMIIIFVVDVECIKYDAYMVKYVLQIEDMLHVIFLTLHISNMYTTGHICSTYHHKYLQHV